MAEEEASISRAAFAQLVAETRYRPSAPDALLSELEGQLLYQPDPRRDGLDALASALALVFTEGPERAVASLSRLARQHREQPLCHFYLFAVHRQAGDLDAAEQALSALAGVDPEDPMVELFRLNLDGKPIPGISEEVRLANIAKFASTALLRNPYRLAVGAVFEAIRDRRDARVLDVGVGSGAQMSELLSLLAVRDHRLRRLEIVGLDFVEEFLETAGQSISTRAEEVAGTVEVRYRPVLGRIEALEGATIRQITEEGALDAVNATIALHEVPGEAKCDALRNLRDLAPSRFVLAEWNYCLENVLPETSVEFLFNVRRVAAAMVAALREKFPISEARAVVRDWLSMAGGQLTCPAADRQECFLDAATWKVLLERSDFDVIAPELALLQYADGESPVAIGADGWSIASSRYANATPNVLIEATCR